MQSFALQAMPPVTHPQAFPAPSVVAVHKANVLKAYDEQFAEAAQLVPLKAQEEIYCVQVVADGLVIVSVHSLALQARPPVTHPQAFPAPSLVALQITKLLKAYDEQRPAIAQFTPLNAQEERYYLHIAADGLAIESVHSFALHATPPVTHPQEFPPSSVVAIHKAKVLKEYELHWIEV